MAEKEQLAVSYAAFVLSGSGAEITADSLNAVLKAAAVTVSPTLVNAVAKALKGRNVTEFFGSTGSAPPMLHCYNNMEKGETQDKLAEL